MKRFLRTPIATDWPEPSSGFGAALRAKIHRFFSANPDYDDKLHRVSEWLIEFDSEGYPFREIGLDKDSLAVIAGPDESNYGFWLDTNMKFPDFPGEPVTEEVFEEYWKNAVKRRIISGAI